MNLDTAGLALLRLRPEQSSSLSKSNVKSFEQHLELKHELEFKLELKPEQSSDELLLVIMSACIA